MTIATSAPSPTRNKRPILIVDDEPEMLFSLRGLLRQEFEVHTASSGADGIKILEQHEIHLVMTDQRMPVMTGVEMLSRVKNEYPGAMRLIFTGYADIKAIIDAINQGNVFRYVTKPWDPEDLVAALREAGERYDQMVRRNQLLGELRAYETRCIAFSRALVAGEHGDLTPTAKAEAAALMADGKGMVGRVDDIIAAALCEPSK